MFLPVLLVRDFGLWAFLSFAIPNILGAAAMGLVLPTAEASDKLLTAHRPQAIVFSRVTIAYQAFFAGWMLTQLLGWYAAGFYLVIPAILLFAIRKDREFSLITTLIFLLSAAIGVTLWRMGALSLPAAKGFQGPAAIAPVCLLGFALCPYLDLTFHYALRRAFTEGGSATSRAAFLLGFVLIFGSMILLTLGYAGVLQSVWPFARALVGVHILLQLAITIVLHQYESGKAAKAEGHKPPGLWPIVLAWFAVGLGLRFVPDFHGWQMGEYVYRAFLGFYALLVPAYVLLRIIIKAPLRLLGGAVLTAAPFYTLGFFTSRTNLLVPGACILLVAVALGIMNRKPPPSTALPTS